MIRPRLTLARLALLGAGLAGAAGIAAATVPAAISAAPTAATTAATPPHGVRAPGQGAAGVRAQAHPLRRALIGLVASRTGQTPAQVRTQLGAGKSLAAVAGSTAQAVRDAALDAVTTRLDARRTAGKLTQARETRLLARAKDRIATLMAATPHGGTTAA